MKNRYFILLSVLFVVLSLSVMAVYKHRMSVHSANDIIANSLIEMQNPIDITRIDVLAGNEYDLMLSDSRRIHGVLPVQTTPEAKHKVVEFLNNCKKPRAILKKQSDESWVVSIYLTTEDSQGNEVVVELSAWLKDKNLVYQ